MSKRNNRQSSQEGAGFDSLYGLNQPSFYDSSCPSYYNNHYGFSETSLRPNYSGHGTVGDGYGKGVNQGQAHYLLPMSGAGSDVDSEETFSETSSNLSDLSDLTQLEDLNDLSTLNSDHISELEDLVQNGGGECICDEECSCNTTGVCDCGADCDCGCAEGQSGGSPTGLPWRWFNPSTPMNTQAINANNPTIPKVGPSGNSPNFDLSNLVGGYSEELGDESDLDLTDESDDSTTIDY